MLLSLYKIHSRSATVAANGTIPPYYHFDILSNEVAYNKPYSRDVQAAVFYSILRELKFDTFLVSLQSGNRKATTTEKQNHISIKKVFTLSN
ncbi:MAG: hypothetical protein WCR86_10635 [Parabacteroides sp.]